MIELEQKIHQLINTQFPEFYKEDQSKFLLFAKTYYEWMQQSDQAVGISRNITSLRDIDHTVDEFYSYFRKKYLSGFSDISAVSTPFLVKNALDIYKAKGTEDGVRLLLNILYGVDSSVYLPSVDIFKASNGEWVIPKYIELSSSPRTAGFINKEIVGTVSGARAFAEGLAARRINGKYIDVLYLSSLRGEFVYGEQVTEAANTITADAPRLIGSLSSAAILNGGQDLAVGDVLTVTSDSGKQGKARVTEISDETGVVSFAIQDGGFGYTTSANVIVSQRVLNVYDITNANTLSSGPDPDLDFSFLEQVSQTIRYIGFGSSTDNNSFSTNTLLTVWSAGVPQSTVRVISRVDANTTAGILCVYPVLGTFNVFDTFYTPSNTASAQVSNTVNSTATGTVIGSRNESIPNANLSIGLTNVVNQFLDTSVAPVVGATSNTYAYISSIGSGETAGFDIELLSNQEEVTINTDMISGNNAGLVPYLDIIINGTNSNATQYSASFDANTGVSNTTEYITTTSAHGFSNGYVVTYMVAAGNTALTALSNNSVYYIINANTTAFQISSNSGGTAIDLTSGLTQTGHSFVWGGYGFPKRQGIGLQGGSILDALTYVQATIGTIEDLTAVNRGQDYTQDPFVLVKEELTYPFDMRDYEIRMENVTGVFVNGEIVEQTFNIPMTAIQISNLAGNTLIEVGELVVQANSLTTNAASGIIYSYGSSGGVFTSMTLRDVVGTFESGTIYPLTTQTTNTTSNATSVSAIITAASAKGKINGITNSTYISVRRLSIANNFATGATILGGTSGAQATTTDIYAKQATSVEGKKSITVGLNANIAANVQIANNVATNLEIVVSGFGYRPDETLTMFKEGSDYVVTAKANVALGGTGEGYFASTKGFISEDKYIHDNDFYQEYSYEVQTKIPFAKYKDVLKKIMHVAGTKMFGKVFIASNTSSSLMEPVSLERTAEVTLTYTNSYSYSSNAVLQVGDKVYQNNGSTNTLTATVSTALSVALRTWPLENQVTANTIIYYPSQLSPEMSGRVVAKQDDPVSNTCTIYLTDCTGVFPTNLDVEYFDADGMARSLWSTVTINKITLSDIEGNVDIKVPILFNDRQANVQYTTIGFK